MYIHNIAITYQYCRYFSVLPLRISNGNFDMGSGLIASRVQLLLPYGLYPARLLCPWDSPGKNAGLDSRFLLQRIFLTQESNPGLLHCR